MNVFKKCLAVALAATMGVAWSTPAVEIVEGGISPQPLASVSASGQGEVSFTIQEVIGAEMIPAVNMFNEPSLGISVGFSSVALKNGDVSELTGSLLNYFKPFYSTKNNRIVFKQVANFPAGGSASISIPVEVTKDTTQNYPFNGFQVNLQADPTDVITGVGEFGISTYTQ